MVTNLSLSEPECTLTTGIASGMVTKHPLKELGYEYDSQSAKARASQRRLERMKHVIWKYTFAQDVVVKKHTTLAMSIQGGRLAPEFDPPFFPAFGASRFHLSF